MIQEETARGTLSATGQPEYEQSWFNCDDGTKLYLHRWIPGSSDTAGHSDPALVLHIVHGMAEHGFRYQRLAGKLTSRNIEVWAADQRGHGKTADININKPGAGGILGHCADTKGFDRVTRDVHAINEAIRKKYPNTPIVLMGHSWGSFITQNYIEQYSNEPGGIDGCILSGTRGPDGLLVKAGVPLMNLFAFFHGKRKGSKAARSLADGPYNKPFKPNRTPFDWLSRDEKEVDAYAADPLCGNLCSTGFYRDLASGLNRIHKSGVMAHIRTSLPVYIISGSADPVGDMGVSPTALVTLYRSLGIKDIEFVLYPGARHETLNETNRDEVMDNLTDWIMRHYKPS
ncbi:MAG: lysophospholipase [Treponema sp.]|nr:lysophospholipase [Treponema sp.]